MIVLKYPSSKDRRTDAHYLKRLDLNSDFFVREVTQMYRGNVPPINTIEIETINRCNNDCSFCPVNKNADTRPYKKMSMELFEKIISELSYMDYRGYISIFSNNEPLIDVRIYDMIKYAKDKLPNAIHCLYTNGTLLDEEKFLQLTASLDYLVIDNYDDDLKLLNNVEPIYQKHKEDKISCKVSVIMRKKNQVLLNRGGAAPNRVSEDNFTSSCVFPFMQLIIRPDGKISRCCQDALANTTLGDVSKETIKEVWEGHEFSDFREELINKGRNSIDFCKNCDSFGIVNYFPEIWTHTVLNAFVNLVWEKKQKGRKIYIFEKNKVTKKVKKILELHGLRVDGILYSKDIEIIKAPESFTVFSSSDYELLDDLDYDFNLLGKSYIVFDDVKHSLNNEFFDEEENTDVEELIQFVDTVRNKKTVIFGTGFSAQKLQRVFHLDVAYYIDNNQNKTGTEFNSKMVWLPAKLKEEAKENLCVVIASVKYDEMKSQLIKNALCKEENIFEGLKFLD